MPTLRIEEGENVRRLSLPPGETRVGRSEVCDIQVTEARSSREHFVLTVGSGFVVLRDLDSTNGTHREDRRVLKARLAPGDRFRVGETWFEIEQEAPRTRRPRGSLAGTLLTLFAPALILLILAELGLSAIAKSRDDVIQRANGRLELAEYRLASGMGESGEAITALGEFMKRHPASAYVPEAEGRIAEIRPRVLRAARARRELDELSAASGSLAFSELYYRHEKLLESYPDLPDIAREVRDALLALDRSHGEKLGELVQAARDEADEFGRAGEFGRAFSVLTAFTARTPAAAERFREDLREVEDRLDEKAEKAFRKVVAHAETLAADGKPDEAVKLVLDEAPRFHGTRYHAFLHMKAESLGAPKKAEGRSGSEPIDRLALRRSYYRRAEQAEELAVAGLFEKAAAEYKEILESVALPGIREEFATRERELRELGGLLARVRNQIAERGREFGAVTFGKTRYLVTGIFGDTLKLEFAGKAVERPLTTLEPAEVLALMHRAKLTPADRLLAAIYCFDMGLRAEWEAEILAALEREAQQESASLLYARKEGRKLPDGGFVAYRGRILTSAERAEEIHREKIASLRTEQVRLYEKLVAQPVFKSLAKLRELRGELDKARQHALKLIFDTKTYFYPYQARWVEYKPVQDEVDRRVAAVREIWNEKLSVTLKSGGAVKGILAEIDENQRELEGLGVDTREFARAVAGLTTYLGRTLTVRSYFHDEVGRLGLEHDRKVMAYNAELATSAGELERRQVEITNEYRMMMGRRAIVLNELLLQAARGHSEEMQREGYFSHQSPHKEREWPHLRVKLEGYKGKAVSENIHRGSGDPQGAHNGWVHSSGHHRNILQRLWTEMGTGQAGRNWTQNFGRTKPMNFPAEGD